MNKDMTHSILHKVDGTWMNFLSTNNEESAQNMVDYHIKHGHEAQWVRIGEKATPEAQADLDRQAKEQREWAQRILAQTLAQEDLIPPWFRRQ